MAIKTHLIDAVGLTGYGLLTAGIYLRFGLASALIFAGGLLLAGALWASLRKKHVV
ncbi:MAG: hypothetical protein HamCj_10600 [Candidatus Hamiltonella defensa (Ceratovacuna japonica)]